MVNIEICHEVGINEVLNDGIDRDSGNVFFSYSVQFRVISDVNILSKFTCGKYFRHKYTVKSHFRRCADQLGFFGV